MKSGIVNVNSLIFEAKVIVAFFLHLTGKL